MRQFRFRILFMILIVVFFSSSIASLLSSIIGQQVLEETGIGEPLRARFVFRDVLSPFLSMGMAFFVMSYLSKRTALPVVLLSQATKQIAAGNFDVRIPQTGRRDEFGQLANDFNTMAAQLQSNEYLRKDFVSSVSHEFKTPLSIIQGYVDLLDSDALTGAERRDYIGVIRRETDRLQRLSHNILQIARLDHQHIKERPTAFSLDEQLRQAALMLEPIWSEKNISINIDLETATYTGNEDIMLHVWLNLIENAVKFTPEGGAIFIRLYEKNGGYEVEISDTGIGMDEKTLERIFEQFFQGEKSHAQAGNGLGLSLVKRILDLIGASVSVKSVPGSGTAFLVTLPGRSQQ